MAHTTQMDDARQGILTAQMQQVLADETIPAPDRPLLDPIFVEQQDQPISRRFARAVNSGRLSA